MESRSQEINMLMTALATAQGGYKKLIPNQDAPGGKFANLDAIITATRESLSSNGLAFFQHIELQVDGPSLLFTVIAHCSGQYISSQARIIPGKTDRQTGNSLEIQKRLHALLLLGIAPVGADPIAFDDNGLEQTNDFTMDQLKKPKAERQLDKTELISKPQYEDMLIELDLYPEITKGILETYNIQTLADLPKSEYHSAMRQIRKLIKNFEEYRK